MTILLGDKSPIEQEARGAIFQNHLLLLGAAADIQEPDFQSPSISESVCGRVCACVPSGKTNR